MTNYIGDIATNADVLVLIGSNPEEAHPVLGMQLRAAVARGMKLIVVDPRDIGLAAEADIHLKLRPGTNVAFANGMAHVIIEEGLVDEEYVRERTEGFEAFKNAVADWTPERAAQVCGIDARDLKAAALTYGTARRAAIAYCLGVTEHSTGTAGVLSLSNLALATGNVGFAGGGVNPLRGQNNVQGACDMGASPTDFTAYQKVANPEARVKFEEAWGVELSADPGLRSTEVFAAVAAKEVRGLFIFGEDPVRTDPDTTHVIAGLDGLEFLVVCDLFLTETAKHADVVLPGVSFAEKEGTFTNTERRVQRVRRAVEPLKGARPDSQIFIELMNRMGYAQPALAPSEVMDEIASVTPSYAGMSHERLDSRALKGQGLQWPCTGPEHPGTPIMHAGGFAKGKGVFMPVDYVPSVEQPCEDYPVTLMTGRVLPQYNACALTGRARGVEEVVASSFIEVNSDDAARLGIADGDRVQVSSRRGRIESRAHVSGKTKPGHAWMPFHFQDGNANWLTIAALDEVCKVPELKVCAVRIEKAG